MDLISFGEIGGNPSRNGGSVQKKRPRSEWSKKRKRNWRDVCVAHRLLPIPSWSLVVLQVLLQMESCRGDVCDVHPTEREGPIHPPEKSEISTDHSPECLPTRNRRNVRIKERSKRPPAWRNPWEAPLGYRDVEKNRFGWKKEMLEKRCSWLVVS